VSSLKKYRSSDEWRALVDEYHASGQTQRDFSHGRGFHPTTLSYWLRRFRPAGVPSAQDRGTVDGRPRLVDVTPRGAVAGAPRQAESTHDEDEAWPYAVDVQVGAKLRLRFRQMPPAGYLRELMMLQGMAPC
jgi:hypothetical protein